MINRPMPFDLDKFLSDNPQIQSVRLPKKNTSSLPSQPNRTQDAYSQARTYILKCSPAISGQGGHAKTFGVCCALLKGFCLNIQEAKSLLDIWNSTCIPCWSHEELEAKLLSAQKSPDLKPQGWMLIKTESKFGNFVHQVFDDDPSPPKEEPKYNHSGILDDPASIAIKFLNDHKTDIGLCAYRWWQGQFYKWNDIHYDVVVKAKIDADLFQYIEKEFLKQYLKDCGEVPAGDEEKLKTIKKKKVTGNLIENVKIGLINIISISEDNKSEPFFLGDLPDGWKPDEVIAAKDKLIHLPSFVNNIDNSQAPKTPKYFSTFSLKYKFPYDYYEGPVKPPPIWEETLNGIWPNDQESIDCIQEFFGYFLTPSTKLQKILMLIGQKRSGKGTIIRTLKHMLGSENICFPTFKSLTTEFGKQALIGKNLAVFPDARITSRTDTGDVVEILLSISGEDDQTINRKYLNHVSTHLTTRFVVASNELPRLTENSGALVSRAITLAFNETFMDQEDIDLEQKLIPEIPYILRWSIDGWKRLSERKRLFQPASGAQIVADFLHLSSPISHFISDGVDIGDTFTSDTKSLYNAWKDWCGWNGRESVGDMDNFIRNLRAAVPKLDFSGESISHNGDGATGARRWSRPIRGLRIKPEPSLPMVLVTSEGINEDGVETTNSRSRIPF
jgi:putative DNA primase/helicase